MLQVNKNISMSHAYIILINKPGGSLTVNNVVWFGWVFFRKS